jgi:cleavage and polyadenylation specificity factor subunit 1
MRWLEAIHILDITAETVSRAMLSGCIARFGCPETITTDQGHQFESQLFHSLAKICGTHLSRTTPHHPTANGLVERLHRTLKAAIMCHADQQWTEALPLVLGIRTAFKENLQSSTPELIYGEPLWIPGEFLVPATPKAEPSIFIQQFHHHMSQLCPTLAARHAFPATFIHKSPQDSSHIFFAARHHTVAHTDETLQIVVWGRQVAYSAPGTWSL